MANGLPDLWDAKLNAWILHWDFHQTLRDPFHLFDANIFHPARYALAFSENLYGAAVFGFPLYAAGVSTLTAYNVLFLLGMFSSALAAWALAREVTGDGTASLLAGVVYAFVPWRISQMAHIQFQWGAFLPLLLLFLLRYLEAGRRRDLALFAVCFGWNALANVHYAVFSGALLAVVLLWELLSGPPACRRRIAAAVLSAAAVGGALVPFYAPYRKAARLYGFERSFHETEWFSGRAVEFLSAGIRNKLYGRSTQRWSHPEGDFFPGLAPIVLAGFAVWRLRRKRSITMESAGEESDARTAPGRTRRVGVVLLDAALVVLLSLWGAASLRPGLSLGPLRLGDSSRLIVLATAVGFLRLAVLFPRRSRYRNLRDLLVRGPMDRRMALFTSILVVGFVVALGLHTPYYRFLFDSFGSLFRILRAPARGIVLFHLALSVLAAWGLSLAAEPAASVRRGAILAAALLVTGIEYRAFPLEVHEVSAEAPAVYHWLARAPVPSGVMEWPLGNEYDYEYEFRSTAHWKPLVNGSSGFFPREYLELSSALRQRPIPDSVWDRVREVEACVLIFHPHDAPPGSLLYEAEAVKTAIAAGRLEPLAVFPHGVDLDYVFRITSGPVFDAGLPPGTRLRAEEALRHLMVRPGMDTSPPFLHLDFPTADLAVSAGSWAYGWAMDDSGVAEVRIATERGTAGSAVYGTSRPDVGRVFPGYPDSGRCGFHFSIPALAPGAHTLIVTVVARDGGQTVLRRNVLIR